MPQHALPQLPLEQSFHPTFLTPLPCPPLSDSPRSTPLFPLTLHAPPSPSSLAVPGQYWVVCLPSPLWLTKPASTCSQASGQGRVDTTRRNAARKKKKRKRAEIKEVQRANVPNFHLRFLFLQQVRSAVPVIFADASVCLIRPVEKTELWCPGHCSVGFNIDSTLFTVRLS